MKRILITGASSGIGEATAFKAARDGWQVIACGRNQAKLEEMRFKHPSIIPLAFDITDIEQCRQALKGISADVVLLNAGSCEYVDADDWDSALFERVFRTNVFGVANCLEALLPTMQAGSKLVFVDSLARLLPFTKSQAYGASKAALFYMAKSLDVDLRDRGVHVQTISPGFVKTPLTDRNDFAMPMRISTDEAAGSIMRHIDRGTRTGYFPTAFAAILRVLSMLPMVLQIQICQRLKATSSSTDVTQAQDA
ncbi:MAG: SDR family NAD(P)-dependent oxidoreductase [Rhizobiales bacterium]|nr:SDR family NAD(P)-dependent oxidoreductase [Hyphomicrobiales bacterium]